MLPGATVTPIDVPAWLDVLTVVVAALGGALFANRTPSVHAWESP